MLPKCYSKRYLSNKKRSFPRAIMDTAYFKNCNKNLKNLIYTLKISKTPVF